MTVRLSVLSVFVLIIQTSDVLAQQCTCNVGKGKFGDCRLKIPEAVWGNHHDDDIGLFGDCLPPVLENTVRCFRWRVARECGRDRFGVKCSLKHRAALDAPLQRTHQRQSVIFISPGFHRRKPKGAYFNRNFCIFNISLDCPSKMVELIPSERTNTLSDSDTCQDYLSFHTHSSPHPHFKLCGRQIMDIDKYQFKLSSRFYAVLWTDSKNESGRFEIEAKCRESSEINEFSGRVLGQ